MAAKLRRDVVILRGIAGIGAEDLTKTALWAAALAAVADIYDELAGM